MSQSIIDLSRRAFIGGAAALGATSLIIPEFAFAETAAEKQAEADAVRNQLVGLQADLETAGENYYAALDEQERAQRSMDEQQVKIDETTQEIEGLQDRLSTRARSMYRSGSTTFIDFLLGASSFAEFTQNWELLNQINATTPIWLTRPNRLVSSFRLPKTNLPAKSRSLPRRPRNANRFTTRFRSRCKTPPTL